MEFILYLRTVKQLSSSIGPLSLEVDLDLDYLIDFETLLEGITVNLRNALGGHSNNFVNASGSHVRFNLAGAREKSCEINTYCKELYTEISEILEKYQKLSEAGEDTEEMEKSFPDTIRKYFDLSSIVLDDSYELVGEDFSQDQFFENLFEAADNIAGISSLPISDEKALCVYCKEERKSLKYLADVIIRKFYESVIVYTDKEDFARKQIVEDIPSVLEQHIDWDGVYNDLISCTCATVIEGDDNRIYEFTDC